MPCDDSYRLWLYTAVPITWEICHDNMIPATKVLLFLYFPGREHWRHTSQPSPGNFLPFSELDEFDSEESDSEEDAE